MFFKNKKVVVTGGSGMIGTHYIKELLNCPILISVRNDANDFYQGRIMNVNF